MLDENDRYSTKIAYIWQPWKISQVHRDQSKKSIENEESWDKLGEFLRSEITRQTKRLKFASKKLVKGSSYPNPNFEVTLTLMGNNPKLEVTLTLMGINPNPNGK